MGPTASGKTAAAIYLRERLPVEIISVDSSQVYRGMDIGTAKPNAAELARAPHRLIDIRDPAEPYSAAQFREDALREMADITAGGRIPLLVGGTLLYFRALERGLSPLPAADAGIRARLAAAARRRGWPALHAELKEIDPDSAARIAPNDAQRIQRALEIHALTGQAPSRLRRRGSGQSLPYQVLKLAVAPAERAELHRRIEDRFHTMIANGLVEEVKALRRRADLTPELPALRTVGYRQIWENLTRPGGDSEMIRRGIYATRQLAKRQLTWLRGEPDVIWFDSGVKGFETSVYRFIAEKLKRMGV